MYVTKHLFDIKKFLQAFIT